MILEGEIAFVACGLERVVVDMLVVVEQGGPLEAVAAEVAIVRTSDSPQALPSLAVVADGTADGAEFSSVFIITKPAEDYLLVDVLDPATLPDG